MPAGDAAGGELLGQLLEQAGDLLGAEHVLGDGLRTPVEHGVQERDGLQLHGLGDGGRGVHVDERGEEAPAVLVHCRVSDPEERIKLRNQIADKVRGVTGMNCVVELVPPRTLPRTSSGKLSRAKAKKLYLSGEIQPLDLAA